MQEKHKIARLAVEKQTLKAMVAFYCRMQHHSNQEICPDCAALAGYALERLDRCPWGSRKPVCAQCSIHCYAPARREQIRAVMRFSGPRMLLTHPILAFRHLLHRFHSSQHEVAT